MGTADQDMSLSNCFLSSEQYLKLQTSHVRVMQKELLLGWMIATAYYEAVLKAS